MWELCPALVPVSIPISLRFCILFPQQVSTSCKDCEDIRRELEKLQSDYCALTEQMEPVLVTNEALRRSSLMLQERSAALLEELSVKEAEWSHREDKLQAAVGVAREGMSSGEWKGGEGKRGKVEAEEGSRREGAFG